MCAFLFYGAQVWANRRRMPHFCETPSLLWWHFCLWPLGFFPVSNLSSVSTSIYYFNMCYRFEIFQECYSNLEFVMLLSSIRLEFHDKLRRKGWETYKSQQSQRYLANAVYEALSRSWKCLNVHLSRFRCTQTELWLSNKDFLNLSLAWRKNRQKMALFWRVDNFPFRTITSQHVARKMKLKIFSSWNQEKVFHAYAKRVTKDLI